MSARSRLRHLGLWLTCTVGLLTGCSQLLFYPEHNLRWTPERVGLEFEEVGFSSTDGTPLHGWMLFPQGTERGTVLFLHGNAQNISTHLASVYWLPAHGFRVFLFDYRGFGKSGGSPSLAGAHQDAAAALALLRARPEVDPSRLIVFGQSIGAAISVHLVATDPVGGIRALVLESPLYGYRDITREKLGDIWLTWPLQWPLSFLMPDRYSPYRFIKDVSPIPLLIIHGEADVTIPPTHSERLFAVAGEPKTYWSVPGVKHIGALAPGTGMQERLVTFLDDILGPPP
ncbi:MAG: alpha/beta hydrolase [Leptospirillia bacterium]